MFTSRKLFVFVLALTLILSACGAQQAPQTVSPAAGTATAIIQQALDEKLVADAQATANAMNGTAPASTQVPFTPTAQFAPTQGIVAPASSATPTVAANGYTLAAFCFSAEKLGVQFPVNREMAYQMFVGKSAGDTVTRPDDMTPLLTDGTNLLYGWTYSRHGGSSEPVVTVTNPTLFMQNGWIHDSDLRSLYGYTLQEAGILDTGRNVTGAGIPGLAQNVRVEGFTFFCAPPSADKGAVLPGHHLVNERSTAYLIQQLPLP